MKVLSLASGSTGNCYHVTDGTTSILIEAGIPIQQIQERLGYKLTTLDGVLISHEHGDHIRAASHLAAKAIDIYASVGTLHAKGLTGHRFKAIAADKPVRIKSLRIVPIKAEHDAAEPLAFVIKSERTGEILVYASDTYYLQHNFSQTPVTIAMIECNYTDEAMTRNITRGQIHPAYAKRVYSSHMSLQTAMMTIATMNTKHLREIWLIHMSDNNAEADRMVEEVQRQTGVLVRIA